MKKCSLYIVANSFTPRSAKKEHLFLYFAPVMQAWDTQVYTLAELKDLPDINTDSIICTSDGQNQMTYRELLSKPLVKGCYQYEVITHGKYIRDEFDAAGLIAKLNSLGAHRYRLVAFSSVNGNATKCDATNEI